MKKIEKWLYEHQHEDVHGQFTRRFWAVFKPWNGTKTQYWPLGDDLSVARGKLKRLRALNDARVEVILDEEKEKREALAQLAEAKKEKARGITFQQFGEMYFDGHIPVPLVRGKRPKRKRTVDRERELFKNLLPYFGDVPLCDINKARILAFAAERIKVPVTTGRKKGDNSPRDIGQEMKCLRYFLNRAVDNDFIAAAPKIKVPQSGHRKNDIKETEYHAMRKAMGVDQARYLTALWETGWRLNELRKLNWHKITTDGVPLVDLKKGVLRLDAADVKEDYPRCTPISPDLMKVLLELKSGVASIDGAVFVRSNGKPIKSVREAFLVAKKKAGCLNARPHDLRRSTIRRWESMGISRQAVMQATGHRPVTTHEKYAELSDDQLLHEFRILLQPPRAKTVRKTAAS